MRDHDAINDFSSSSSSAASSWHSPSSGDSNTEPIPSQTIKAQSTALMMTMNTTIESSVMTVTSACPDARIQTIAELTQRHSVDNLTSSSLPTTSMLLLLGPPSLVVLLVVYVLFKLRQTRRLLRDFPTVQWRPRFANYRYQKDEQEDDTNTGSSTATHGLLRKLPSSNVTSILPRMKRLQGPYGCYGTVYGFSTAVVHMAHPVPARAVLLGGNSSTHTTVESTTSTSQRFEQQKQRRRRRRSSTMATWTGAIKAPAYNHFENFSGKGIFTADGDEWKTKRASVLHVLMMKGRYAETIQQQAETTADRLMEAMLTETKRRHSTRPVDIVPLLQRATMGLIYRYLTHDDDRTLECNNDNDDTAASSFLNNYLSCIVRIRMILLAQSRSIWFLLPRWCYLWCSSMYREEEEPTLRPIRSMANKAIGNAKQGSPLQQLSLKPTHAYGVGGNTGNGNTNTNNKNLLDETITLLFAGQDTSAATLSWTLHLLSIHPDIQQRLYDELRSARDDPDRSMYKVPFLDAVIKESMRLFPVAPFVVRRIVEDLELPTDASSYGKESTKDCGTTAATTTAPVLRKDTLACIWIYSLHRNPTLWDRADDFWPDRWLTGNDDSLASSSSFVAKDAYIPYCLGPRNCVGQPLAQVVLRVLLAKLVVSVEFRDARLDDNNNKTDSSVAESIDPKSLYRDMQAGFTVLPLGGVLLLMKERLGTR